MNTNEGPGYDCQDEFRRAVNEPDRKQKAKLTCILVPDSSNIHPQAFIFHMWSKKQIFGACKWLQSVNKKFNKFVLMLFVPL